MGWENDPIWLAHIFQLDGSTTSTNDIFRFFDGFPRIVCSGVLGFFLYMECFLKSCQDLCLRFFPTQMSTFPQQKITCMFKFPWLLLPGRFWMSLVKLQVQKVGLFFPSKKNNHMVILKNKGNTSWKVETTRNLGVSENSGTPKSSILIGISIINHPFWGPTIFGTPRRNLVDFWWFRFNTPVRTDICDKRIARLHWFRKK